MSAASNGNGTGPRGRLDKLLAELERDAEAVRRTIAMLGAHGTASTQRRAPDTIAQAIALDAARRGKTRRPIVKSKRRSYHHAAERAARRKRTAVFLDGLSTSKPSTDKLPGVSGGGIGTLLRHGFIKRSGDGYIRTAKPFEP